MDKTLVAMGVLTLAAYLFLTVFRPETAAHGLESTVDMFVKAAPWIIVSMFAAGLMEQLIRAESVAHFLGRGLGPLGVVVGAVLGLFGTGSRWAVYPLAMGLLTTEANPGAVFAFMTTWQLVSLPRLPAEFPFLGVQFTFLRAVVSVLVAVLGGLLVDWYTR